MTEVATQDERSPETSVPAMDDGVVLGPVAAEGMTIYQRLALIVAELPAIGKGQRNAQQDFMYRGHDDVMNELNPLLSKYGVFFVPNVIERVTAQRETQAGRVMYEVNLHVRYTFYGLLGDKVIASAWGEGTDSGDKSTNKAMTMALKNVLAQTFAVSTQEQSELDTDRSSPEPTVARGRQTFNPALTLAPGAPKNWKEIEALVLDLDSSLAMWIAEAVGALYGKPVKELDTPLKIEAARRIANALARIRDGWGVGPALMREGDFPPPTAEEYREVFAWAFSGVAVEGPGTPFEDLAEEDAASAAQESADAAERDTEAEQPELPVEPERPAQEHRDPAA